ncbi:metal ABC transporter ATP-binding protein [Halothiobacillus sp. DCM-1]|uniref:metal ABC transporter ATP-binding protein n=1 Tax=Halothiobacillus sp. DCM-1 TaxID=3112558 RepID=UPI0032472398
MTEIGRQIPATVNAVDIHGVTFAYEQTPVLEQVTLSISRGDFVAVIGPNGGGKTTLMRLMLGLIKPTAGTIRLLGQMPGCAPERIGYVPQHSNTAPGFPATVEQIVLMGLPARKTGLGRKLFHTPAERELAASKMQTAGVLELRHKRLNALSGGQRQRVLIARALMTQPELLILDEPLSNIDPYGRQCILETLRELPPATTVVMVSHDLGITANAINRIVAVNRFVLSGEGGQLTQAMLDLMYGVHADGCPVHSLLHHLIEQEPSRLAARKPQ